MGLIRLPATMGLRTASAWKPPLGFEPGTGKIEKGCHSVALMAGQLTWMYAPTLNWYPLPRLGKQAVTYAMRCKLHRSGSSRDSFDILELNLHST